MAVTVPQQEPPRLTAGTTWEWTKSIPTFPASEGWELSYVVTGPTTLRFTATADGDGYAISVAPADTKVPGGAYRWASYVEYDGDRYPVESGLLTVDPDLAMLSDGEASLSFAERTLKVVELALEQRLPSGLEEYQIAGKAVKHIPLADLLKLRNKLRHEVAAERNGGAMSRFEVAFVAPR